MGPPDARYLARHRRKVGRQNRPRRQDRKRLGEPRLVFLGRFLFGAAGGRGVHHERLDAVDNVDRLGGAIGAVAELAGLERRDRDRADAGAAAGRKAIGVRLERDRLARRGGHGDERAGRVDGRGVDVGAPGDRHVAGGLGGLGGRDAEQVLAQIGENERVDFGRLLDDGGADLGGGVEQHGLDVAGPGLETGYRVLEIPDRRLGERVGVGDEL